MGLCGSMFSSGCVGQCLAHFVWVNVELRLCGSMFRSGCVDQCLVVEIMLVNV
jgi:hypothetical protein